MIDGLDEAPFELSDQERLINILGGIPSPVSLLVMSRPTNAMRNILRDAIEVHITADVQDMTKFVEDEIRRHPSICRTEEDLKRAIELKILEKANGRFGTANLIKRGRLTIQQVSLGTVCHTTIGIRVNNRGNQIRLGES